MSLEYPYIEFSSEATAGPWLAERGYMGQSLVFAVSLLPDLSPLAVIENDLGNVGQAISWIVSVLDWDCQNAELMAGYCHLENEGRELVLQGGDRGMSDWAEPSPGLFEKAKKVGVVVVRDTGYRAPGRGTFVLPIGGSLGMGEMIIKMSEEREVNRQANRENIKLALRKRGHVL